MTAKTELSSWTVQEISLINTVDLFRLKPRIMKKAEARFDSMRTPLTRYCEDSGIEFPEGTDLIKGQIARGENHNGFPFVSFDLPQKFSKTEFYTYRALFWWGHYLGFSLILKGEKLPQFAKRLTEIQNEKEWSSVYYSTSPWEWEMNDENFKSVSKTDPQLMLSQIEEVGILKLIRIYPVSAEKFADLDWEKLGLQAFKTFSTITR